MKTVLFSCSNCGLQMAAEEIYCGQTVRCTQCNQNVAIPQKSLHQIDTQEQLANVNPQSDFGRRLTSSPFLLWIIIGIQLGCLIALLCIKVNIASSPQGYEYLIHSLNQSYQRSISSRAAAVAEPSISLYRKYNRYSWTSHIRELSADGWEYVCPISNTEVLFRRKK